MNLQEFFKQNSRAALAFSGGVDSAYLLYEAIRCGCRVRAYYVKTAFQPDFEYRDALRIAEELNAELVVLEENVLACEEIASNPCNRCYYCKSMLFRRILETAEKDGFSLLMDGTNASDDASDRPGMKALQELQVRSPLRECGLTKEKIRCLSKEAGLFTWDKPAYACLATRIPWGTRISEELLRVTEQAEDFMMRLGFKNFRVRMSNGGAKLQVSEEELSSVLEHREEIVDFLKRYYPSVLLDLEVRS